MCLVVKSTEPMIAEDNIICYKEVFPIDEKHCHSFYWKYQYEYNVLYDLDVEIMALNTNEVHKGYHTYKYSDHVPDYASHSKYTLIVECIIPKGSKYFEGMFCDDIGYCSDHIIVTNKKA